jgi:hypothetical protein
MTGHRTTTQWTAIAVGAGTFLVLAGVAAQALAPLAREMDIVRHADPPNRDAYYLAHNRGGHVDHHVLYHGIDEQAVVRLRAADVLFLGNSRLMFVLQTEALQSFFRDLGLTYYVLGFGHEEQDDFPAEIIERFDLRPAVVVVNVDGFFWDEQSDWADKVVQETPFDAWKVQVEAEIPHAVRRRLHATIPHIVDIHHNRREFVIYRSREDGTWFVATPFGEGSRFDWPPAGRHEPSARSIRTAQTFKRALTGRGSRIVLCVVPAPDVSLYRAQAMARHLDAPLVAPQIRPLRTIDRSHLSEESAGRYVKALLEDLRPLLEPVRDRRTAPAGRPPAGDDAK